MLDLTKPVRTIEGNIFGIVVGKRLDGRIICEEAGGFLFSRSAELLENIPEPKKSINGIVGLFPYGENELKIFTTDCVPEDYPSAKITYTEGAENPWRIEEVK